MRFLAIWLASIFAVGELPPPVPGDFPPAVPETRREWRAVEGDSGQVALYENGVQIGNWHYRAAVYQTYRNGVWGEIRNVAPVPPPVRAERQVAREAIPFTSGTTALFAAWSSGSFPATRVTGSISTPAPKAIRGSTSGCKT